MGQKWVFTLSIKWIWLHLVVALSLSHPSKFCFAFFFLWYILFWFPFVPTFFLISIFLPLTSSFPPNLHSLHATLHPSCHLNLFCLFSFLTPTFVPHLSSRPTFYLPNFIPSVPNYYCFSIKSISHSSCHLRKKITTLGPPFISIKMSCCCVYFYQDVKLLFVFVFFVPNMNYVLFQLVSSGVHWAAAPLLATGVAFVRLC